MASPLLYFLLLSSGLLLPEFANGKLDEKYVFTNPLRVYTFSRIFGSKPYEKPVVGFINAIMGYQGEEMVRNATFLKSIQILSSNSIPVVDVLCETRSRKRIIFRIWVAKYRGFLERSFSYASSARFYLLNGSKPIFHNKPVVFIGVSPDFNTFPVQLQGSPISKHILVESETRIQLIKELTFVYIELGKFNKSSLSVLENEADKWLFFLKYLESVYLDTDFEIEKFIDGNEALQEACAALNTLNWSPQEMIQYNEALKLERQRESRIAIFRQRNMININDAMAANNVSLKEENS